MILEWSAEQVTDITQQHMELEFLATWTNMEQGVHNLELVLQQMHTALMALTRYGARDIVANSRKNPLEALRRVQKRCDPTTGGRMWNLRRTIISPGRCSLSAIQAGIERWESYVSRNQKRLKDKSEDEIKLAFLRNWRKIDTQLESFANVRGCAPGSRDVRGGEIWFKDP